MNKKDEFLAMVENQVEQWRSEILKFRVIAEVADKDAQVKHYQIINDISEKIHSYEEEVDTWKNSSEEQWGIILRQLSEARDQVSSAIEEARKKIN